LLEAGAERWHKSGFSEVPATSPLRAETYSLGSQENFRREKALAAADAIEDEELIRKLALRK
jgi:hypothetical protein